MADPFEDIIADDPFQDIVTEQPQKSETILQKAIKTAELFVPQSKEEWSDVPRIAASASGLPSLFKGPMGGFTIGGIGKDSNFEKMFDESMENLSTPKTEWGKEASNFYGNAIAVPALAIGGKRLLGSGIKGIGSLISKNFRTSPVKKSIEDLIFKGKNTVRSSVDDMFNKYNEKFGKGLEQLESNMTTNDFSDLVAKSSDELGRYEASSELLTKELGRILEEGNRILSPSEVQSKAKRIIQMLGKDSRAKAIFHKHFLDKIPETVKGLKELKEAHAPVYQVAKESKMLNTGLFRKIAEDKIGPEELKKAKDVESKLGVNVLSPIEKEGSNLQRIILNKKVGAGVTGLLGAGGSLLAILKALKG